MFETARNALRQWLDHRPDNFYTADPNLRHILMHYLGNDDFPNLVEAGANAATHLDTLARHEDLLGNHPRLERYTGIGERVEQIDFHPNHDAAGEFIWNSGIMAMQAQPGRVLEQMALFILFAHNGEMGHACSLACTMGMVRVLQQVAEPDVQGRFLPPLLRYEYATMQHAAQFLTEIQGGSDVGANAVQAASHPDGTWRLTGEKWFCSNINAQQFLMTARPDGAADGTRGLGLFVVPRTLEDGSPNGFTIRRLKDKLGTRTLASAEVDFADAVAYPVGPLDRGFKNVVEYVLNTSRLANAAASVGIMCRATIDARSFACHREAFGHPIAHYPMVQETLADTLTETYAAQSSTCYVAHLLDRIETGVASDDEHQLYRLLVNVNKYWTAIRGTQIVHQGIEILGGNGAIETFSILPRLYRDMIVLESWEGTHNVLALQVLRDCARYGLHESFFQVMGDLLDTAQHEALSRGRAITRAALYHLEETAGHILGLDAISMQAHARRLCDSFATVAQSVLLLKEAQWELAQGLATHKLDVTSHYLNRFVWREYDPLQDDDLLPRIARLAHVE